MSQPRRKFLGTLAGLTAGALSVMAPVAKPCENSPARRKTKTGAKVVPVKGTINVGVFTLRDTLFLGTLAEFRKWRWPVRGIQLIVKVRGRGFIPYRAIVHVDANTPPPRDFPIVLSKDRLYRSLG